MTTATKRVHITDLHSDHSLWLNSLSFFKEEINILERRLEEVAKRNTESDVLAHLEHFQNQYIRQREVIDELRHDIKQHENSLEHAVKENATAVDHRLFPDHTDLRDRVITFEKLYADLKAELMRWLSERL
jgi:seryl-tRNA synthetase